MSGRIYVHDENGYDIIPSPKTPMSTELVGLEKSSYSELLTAKLTPTSGWKFSYGINTDMLKTTISNSGTATSSNGKGIVSTSTSNNGTAKIETKDIARYIAGIGSLVRFSAIFTSGVANSQQIIGIGDQNDGLFFGYNGASFGILRRSNSVDTWVNQADWNYNKFDGTVNVNHNIDTTKGNVFQIRFQWLGFGAMSFYIADPSTGKFELVHRIKYANTSTETSTRNPNLPIMMEVKNTGNTSNIVLQSASALSAMEGDLRSTDTTTPFTLERTLVSSKSVSTETNLITIRNKGTFNSIANRIILRIECISISTDGANSVALLGKLNATLGGTPSYVDVSTLTSPVDYDISGTTVTGGTLKIGAMNGKVEGREYPRGHWTVFLYPNDTFTLSAISASASNVGIAITWSELY